MILYVTYCSGKKRSVASRVEDLYQSNRVKRFVEFCSSRGIPWAILSAKYGLLFPGSVVEPYDVTIKSEKSRRCFLGLRVIVNGVKLPVEESNEYLMDLCNKISSQLAELNIRRVVFYTQSRCRGLPYIKILQAALEGCRDLPRDENTLDYVTRKNLIQVITKLTPQQSMV